MIQRKTLNGLMAVGLITMTASAGKAIAQDPAQTPPAARPGAQAPQSPSTPDVKTSLTLQRSDKLVGMDVTDSSGGKVGRVEDLVIKPTGEIGYVVISGNTPDTMAKQIVVPWRSFRAEMASTADRRGDPVAGVDRAPATDKLVLLAERDRLGSAPGFDRMQWPKAGDTTVFTESDRFFAGGAVAGTPDARGGRPVEAGMSSPTLFRLSQLRNQQVTDATGKPSGTITQIVVDPITGRVNYVGYATNSVAGSPTRTVALPWESVQASRRDDKDNFQVRVQADRLQSAPEFIGGEEGWKRMSDPTYVGDVYKHYQVRPYWNDGAPGRNMPGDTPRPDQPKKDTDQPRNDPKNEPPRNDPK